MWRALGLLALSVHLLLMGCGSMPVPTAGASDPAQAFDVPPTWPGYSWSFQGKRVGWQVISTAAGPAHCALDQATFMTISWPPGTYSETSQHARQYIRDPKGTIPVGRAHLVSTLDLHAHLPAGARATELTYGHINVYVGPDADQVIYVAGENTTERWPRSDPMTLCA